MKNLKPQLLLSLKNYSKEKLIKDLTAGIIVAIIALPLSIALALASGVSPEQGLYTAIIAGFFISALGGSKVQIAGPTAAFATIVAGIVAANGMSGLATATILAGIFLVIIGVFKLGSLIRYVPYTITTGFTAGIAVTILIGQIKDFLGLTFQNSPIETIDKVKEVVSCIGTLNIWALVIGCVSLAILILWPMLPGFFKKIPASLIAVIVTSLIVGLFDMPVNTIGDLYTISNAPPTFHAPDFSLSTIKAVLPDAVTIAILAAIESLLSCVVADEMIGAKHNSNMELVAQGVGNAASALFGGIPATGAIARTAANIKNGGTSPVSGIVHSVVLLAILVFLMPYAALIPMPCIAAILFQVAYNMSGWRTVVRVSNQSPKSDIAVLAVTFILTVVFDLVVAIVVGLLLACLLFIKRMASVTKVKEWTYSNADSRMKSVPANVMIYEISGPMFFGAADKIPEIDTNSGKSVMILRMSNVPALDITAMNGLSRLYDQCQKNGIKLIFSHVNAQPMTVIKKAGLFDMMGSDCFQPNIDAAIQESARCK